MRVEKKLKKFHDLFSLTVVKSGPGYHEEKTYNFGPEGVETHSRSSGVVQPKLDKPMGPDMSKELI